MTITWTKQAAELFRDYITDGVPLSGLWKPHKPNIRTWGGQIEDALDDHEALLVALGARPIFRAHLNGTNQSGVANNVYTDVQFSAVDYDVNGYFDVVSNHEWVCPLQYDGKTLLLMSNIWFQNGAIVTTSPTYLIKIVYRVNGAGSAIDVGAGFGTSFVGWNAPCPAWASGTVIHRLTAGNTYRVQAIGSTATSLLIDGNPAHTYFMGAVL